MGQKEPPRPGSTICYGQSGPERATKTRQYDLAVDLLRRRMGQKEPPRPSGTIGYGQEWATTRQYDLFRPRVSRKEPPRPVPFVTAKSNHDPALRFATAKSGPEKATKTRQYDFVTAKSGPERATKTRQYDLLRPRVGQKEPPRQGSTICYG